MRNQLPKPWGLRRSLTHPILHIALMLGLPFIGPRRQTHRDEVQQRRI